MSLSFPLSAKRDLELLREWLSPRPRKEPPLCEPRLEGGPVRGEPGELWPEWDFDEDMSW